MDRLTELIAHYERSVEHLAENWDVTTRHMEMGEIRQHREYCQIEDDTLSSLKKLKYYEDLDEAGRLIELPFDIGDIVYVIRFSPYQIVEFQVSEIKKNKFCWWFKTGKNMASFTFNDLGNWVFLTKEEAETKLAELKGGA